MFSKSTWTRSSQLIRQNQLNQLIAELNSDESTASHDVSLDTEFPHECSSEIGESNCVTEFSFSSFCENELCSLILDHHYSKAQLDASISMMNSMLSAFNISDKIPSAQKFWRKATKVIAIEYFFICNSGHCHGPYVGEPKSFKPYTCGRETIHPKLSMGNYLIKIPLRKQLEIMMPHLSKRATLSTNEFMNSILDGQLAKNAKLYDDCLTLTAFSDEVPASKSSKLNILPFYCIINELDIKSKNNNVFLIGIYVGRAKPTSANTLLKPIINDFVDLEMNSVDWICLDSGKKFSMKFKLICFIADAPMRAYIKSVKQFSSRFGCDWCKIEGVYESNAIKFYPQSRTRTRELLRAKSDFLLYAQGHINDLPTFESIKANSEFLNLQTFDIVWGFSVDLMHSVFLGVVKDIFKRGWFNSEMKNKPFYIQNTMGRIEQRIKRIQITSEHVRPIRILSEFRDWKANEFASFLLYFFYPTLLDILPYTYLAHFSQLSEAINILCSKNLKTSEISRAEFLIHEFIDNLQVLYGTEFLTYNVHILSHLPECTRKLGPLIPISAFLSENKMGQLKKSTRKFSDLPQSLANIHLINIYQNSNSYHRPKNSEFIVVGREKTKELPSSFIQFINTNFQQMNANSFISLESIRVNNVIFTTDKYDLKFRRKNSFIMNKNGVYIIQKIFYESNLNTVICKVKVISANLDNILMIKHNHIQRKINIETKHKHILQFSNNSFSYNYIILNSECIKCFTYEAANSSTNLIIKPFVKLT